MGTNYYMYENACDHCNRGDNKKHIGKSSAGWCFALRVYPEDGINTLEDWKKVLSGDKIIIKDEYGDIIQLAVLLSTITDRNWKRNWEQKPASYDSWKQFHAANYSERGPYGLLRSRIEATCIGHGDGTYDLINAEFC